jgi:hypothetical protein
LLRVSAQASEKAFGLARLRYQFGVADFLTVLDAERTHLLAQELLAGSETRAALTLIAVYKALEDGWEDRRQGYEGAGVFLLNACHNTSLAQVLSGPRRGLSNQRNFCMAGVIEREIIVKGIIHRVEGDLDI